LKVNSDNRQLYIQDFVNVLSREKYIVQPIQDKENWREIGKYNQYKIGNQTQIFPTYLQDQIIANHLEEKYIIGCKISKTKKTNRIIIDIDKPDQREIAFKFMFEVTHKEKPDLLFTSSFRNHLHAYYMFEGLLNETDLNTLKNHLKGFEVYPANNGIRLPLSRGSFWLNSNLTPQNLYDKNASISEIHNLITNGISFTDTDEFRAILSDYKRKERDTLSKAKAKLYTSDLKGGLWDRVKELKTVGLTESGTRNKAHLDLIAYCIHKGFNELETVEYCKEWHLQQTNGLSQDVNNGNWNQIERESRYGYNYYKQTYDPLKAKNNLLSRSDYKRIDKIVKSLSLGGRYEQNKRAKKVIMELYKLSKKAKSRELEINTTLWNKWGSNQNLDIKWQLLEKGLIKIIEYPQYNKDKKRYETATKYRLDFLPTLNL